MCHLSFFHLLTLLLSRIIIAFVCEVLYLNGVHNGRPIILTSTTSFFRNAERDAKFYFQNSVHLNEVVARIEKIAIYNIFVIMYTKYVITCKIEFCIWLDSTERCLNLIRSEFHCALQNSISHKAPTCSASPRPGIISERFVSMWMLLNAAIMCARHFQNRRNVSHPSVTVA